MSFSIVEQTSAFNYLVPLTAAATVEYGEGVSPHRGLAQRIRQRLADWVDMHELIVASTLSRGYKVQFRKRKEILDVIDCQIDIWVGSKNWRGRSFGITTHRAFARALNVVYPT